MATIVRGTTPTLTFTLPFEVDNLDAFWISFKQQNKVELNKEKGASGVTQKNYTITVTLSQEETLQFGAGKCLIQIRARDTSGKAVASNTMNFEVADVLRSGVI